VNLLALQQVSELDASIYHHGDGDYIWLYHFTDHFLHHFEGIIVASMLQASGDHLVPRDLIPPWHAIEDSTGLSHAPAFGIHRDDDIVHEYIFRKAAPFDAFVDLLAEP
jgi:hypothetical protein